MNFKLSDLSFYVLLLSFLLLPAFVKAGALFLVLTLILVLLQAKKLSWAHMSKPWALILIAFLVTLAYGYTYSMLCPTQALQFLITYLQLAAIFLLVPFLSLFQKQAPKLIYAYLVGCIITPILILFKAAPLHCSVVLFFGAYLALSLAFAAKKKQRSFYFTLALILLVFALWQAGVLNLFRQQYLIQIYNDYIESTKNVSMLWKQKPVLGFGLGSFVTEYVNNQALPANTFYTLLINHGIVGLGLFLAVLMYLLQNLYLQKDRRLQHLGLVFVALFVFSSFGLDLLLTEQTRLWFILWYAYFLGQSMPKT